MNNRFRNFGGAPAGRAIRYKSSFGRASLSPGGSWRHGDTFHFYPSPISSSTKYSILH